MAIIIIMSTLNDCAYFIIHGIKLLNTAIVTTLSYHEIIMVWHYSTRIT